MTEPLETRLRRLEQERDEADRRYNEALTELDRAVPRLGGVAGPEPAIDEHQLATLNDAWNILPAPPAASGIKARLAGFVWRTIAPYLQRQLTFNSVLVDHINRTTNAQRRAHQRAVENAAALHAQLEALTVFHARLMLYLQQITAYVDTKDRQTGGSTLILNAALSDVAEGQAKYRESFAAREARMVAAVAAHEELRGMLSVAQQAIASLKRHVESVVRDSGLGVRGSGLGDRDSGVGDRESAAGAPQFAGVPRTAHRGPRTADAFAPSLDAYKYVGFEDQFRGSQDVIRARQESYLTFFEAGRQDGPVTGDVLDVGCGRGEFIELLNARGIPARGIDLNSEMAEVCRARGLNVAEADAVGYLEHQPDASLGGLFAAQVVEHLEPAYLLRFLDLAFLKLQPGGTLVLETLNPACWTAFFESYIRDITHRWPLHPDTLKYLVTASGFTNVSVEFRSPVPEHERLQPIASGDQDLMETFNENVRKLNARMFTHMDYAVVAVKNRGVD
jgi:SAM-dependent methyltransferase